MSAAPDHVVILNPRAAAGRAGAAAAEIRRLFRAAGIGCEVRETRGPGDAARIAEEVAAEARVVVAAGGDGTLHEVANGLARAGARRRAVLGILPCGTGNDFARALAIPDALAGAFAVLRAGRRRPIDLARAAGRLFVNNLAVGFGALVVHDVARRGRLARLLVPRRLAYRAAGVGRLGHAPPVREVEVDGRSLRGRFFEIHVGNGVFCGGGARFVPEARPDDGLLDVAIVEALPLRRIVRALLATQDGGLRAGPGITLLRGRRIAVRGAARMPVQMDGEALAIEAPAQLEIEVWPGALEVIAG